MLIVDSRAGSCDLYPHLVARGLPTEMTRLEYGDVSFLGNGPNGMVSIGVEYKKTNDALACMTGGRYAGHQLPGMASTYQYHWLLLEGIVRCGSGNDSDGVLQVRAWPEGWRDYRQGSRYIMWRDWCHWLMSLQQMAGVRVAHTSSIRESAAWIAALYSWWGKDWGDHKSVNAMYFPPLSTDGNNSGAFSSILNKDISFVRRVSAQFPGIGDKVSLRVEKAFISVDEMILASQEKWAEVVGKATAEKVYKAIHEGHK